MQSYSKLQPYHAAKAITRPPFDQDQPLTRIRYILALAKSLNCLSFCRKSNYYAITERELYRARMAEGKTSDEVVKHSSLVEDEAYEISKSSSSSATPKTKQPDTGKPTTSSRAPQESFSAYYPSPLRATPTFQQAQVRPASEIQASTMRSLKADDFLSEAPTADMSTTLLELEISKAEKATVLWVHVLTDMVEDERAAELRKQFWNLAIHGIPEALIKHLYAGDIAGLLLALIPQHEGRADELQAKAVMAFDLVTKLGQSFLNFKIAFTDALEVLHAVGIDFPDVYVRLKFVLAMKKDTKYNNAMVEILSHRPVYDLEEIISKLTGYAATFKDTALTTPSRRGAALLVDDQSANQSTADTSAVKAKKAKRAAEKTARKAKTVALQATSTATPSTTKVKNICFAYLDGKECTKKNCAFRHEATAQEKSDSLKHNKAKACRNMRDKRSCDRDPCRFSHDPAVLDKARKEMALAVTTGQANVAESWDNYDLDRLPPLALLEAHGYTTVQAARELVEASLSTDHLDDPNDSSLQIIGDSESSIIRNGERNVLSFNNGFTYGETTRLWSHLRRDHASMVSNIKNIL